jgi:hypothetical protein
MLGAQSQPSAKQAMSVATYDLKEPFHSTDCEAQRGCCEGWTVDESAALMFNGLAAHRLREVCRY